MAYVDDGDLSYGLDSGSYDPDVHGSAEEYVREHRPERYASIARQVDLAMAHGDKPCTGNGCDEGDPCPRHARTAAVVARYLRAKGARS